MNRERIAWIAVILFLIVVIDMQRQAMGQLIGIIEDKNVYIDAGCHGRYQGTEYPPFRNTGD